MPDRHVVVRKYWQIELAASMHACAGIYSQHVKSSVMILPLKQPQASQCMQWLWLLSKYT